MTKVKILKLINQGEGLKLEFKPSLSDIQRITEIVCSFANSKGGIVLIGVSDDGKIHGVDIGKQTIERLTNIIVDNLDPKIYPEITPLKIDKKSLILIEVSKSTDKPHLVCGKAFIRIGKNTKSMSRSEYERLLLGKHRHKLQFDKQVCEGASLKNIDWKFVKKEFMPLYERISKRETAATPQSLLASLGCIKVGKPTNAGILLFGKNPQEFFMNAYIALARYKGEEVGPERLDYKEFNGNLFQQIDACDEYIKSHIAVMSKLLPYQVQRQDIPEYGLFSIRELITNALCNRDYENQNTKAIIKILTNRIEFFNPGGLPEDITPKNILDKQYSRNPIIAKVLAKVKYIEELGEGWNKIVQEHKTHPLKPKMPKIKSDRYTSLVIIFSTKDKFERKKEFVELNERQKIIMDYLRGQKKINRRICMELLKTSKDTAVRELSFLQRKGLVKRKGIGKSTYYHLA